MLQFINTHIILLNVKNSKNLDNVLKFKFD